MIFDKFKGISRERETEKREKSNLDVLLDFYDETIHSYKSYNISNYWQDRKKNGMCGLIYTQLNKKKIFFDEQDLTSLIFAKANKDYALSESVILGLYTGVLLQVLTERNKKKGKRTKFYINGMGHKFDYLFSFATGIDELIVDSFAGDYICARIASQGGKANKIILHNNKGNRTAWEAGAYQGNIGTLIVSENKGDDAAGCAGLSRGAVGLLIMSKNKGEYTAWLVGNYDGNIGAMIVNDDHAKSTASSSGCRRGSIGTILVINSSGDKIAEGVGQNGFVNKLVLYKVAGEHVAKNAKARQIIRGEEALAEYQKISQQYKLDVVFKLLDSFKSKTPEEIIAATEKIGRYLGK